ncbi:MAG: hypothetical protein NT029_12045 [Armatimonadetes bacterium]|nr:hypothetical protein [Armatimonadota bacterium]
MLRDRVSDSIRALYPDADTSHLIESGGRVTGYAVDQRFSGMVSRNDIHTIWDKLRSDLGPDAVHVGFLLFLSPEAVAAFATSSGVQA